MKKQENAETQTPEKKQSDSANESIMWFVWH